jgi:hypothetical protein
MFEKLTTAAIKSRKEAKGTGRKGQGNLDFSYLCALSLTPCALYIHLTPYTFHLFADKLKVSPAVAQ